MRFTLSSTVLNNRLQSLSKVINAKNTLPILGSFLFDIRGGKMTITASDGENVMTSEIPLSECDGEASFAVPNRTIMDAVKEIPEQPLSFTLDTDTNEITVTYQNGHYQFTAQSILITTRSAVRYTSSRSVQRCLSTISVARCLPPTTMISVL